MMYIQYTQQINHPEDAWVNDISDSDNHPEEGWVMSKKVDTKGFTNPL